MPVTIDGTNGITTPTYGGTDTSEYLVPVTAFKNRIINGAMMIDQRNAGAALNSAASGSYGVDRFVFVKSGSAVFNIQQNAGSVTPPAGFTKYLGFTVGTGATVNSGDYYLLQHKIEGYNFADMAYGTANAAITTLSFWVRSSLTGTFSGSYRTDVSTRTRPFTYTISSANTWEQKTITVAGDTSGTWGTTNNLGLEINFNLGVGSTFLGTDGIWAGSTYFGAAGSVNVAATSGATFYITGVQLEKGSTATSFDYRPYGTELQLCQRYYQTISNIWANTISGCLGTMPVNDVVTRINFYPSMRTTPTIVTFSENGTSGRISVNRTAAGFAANQLGADSTGVTLLNGSGSNFTSVSNVTFAWTANAEL